MNLKKCHKVNAVKVLLNYVKVMAECSSSVYMVESSSLKV